MTKPLIGYRNIGREANSWSSDPARLAFNGLTYDGWTSVVAGPSSFSFTGTAKAANYFAIAEHNLAGSTVSLYADGVFVVSESVLTNSPFLVRFSQRTASTWEIRTSLFTAFAYVNVCNVGRILELERGFWNGHAPMRHNRANRYLDNLSDSGQLLGRKLIREGATGQISLKNVSSDWVRDEWEPFTLSAERYGFFLQHNPDQYPDEVAYCWTTGDSSMSQSGVGFIDNKGRNTVSMNVQGIV